MPTTVIKFTLRDLYYIIDDVKHLVAQFLIRYIATYIRKTSYIRTLGSFIQDSYPLYCILQHSAYKILFYMNELPKLTYTIT